MRILITGILGFVAGYVISELKDKGHEIVGIDILDAAGKEKARRLPRDVTVLNCDLSELGQISPLLDETFPDLLIHLAAQSSAGKSFDDPHGTFISNAVGSLNLLESMRKKEYHGKAVFVGTSEMYRGGKERVPVNEDAPFLPVSPYAASKAAQDMMAEQYSQCYALKIVRTRSFSHTGPGQTTVFAIPAFAQQLALIGAGKKEPVLEVGNLDVVRDYTDVRDVARAYVLLLEKGRPGEAYNVSSGKGRSVRDILMKMIEISGLKVELKTIPSKIRRSDIEYLVGDNSKISRETGWRPDFGIDETLSSVLEYWREQVREGTTPGGKQSLVRG
ncbi:MAG: GDP-mannose 4,6-dehydratase [Candidatus Eisenbacteria bacterium]|nr:GDP-mannose 4,6-dehydratase [Candidatus Eisenbacteria bacterium]